MTESKIEKLKRILKGEILETPPYAVWRHFPKDDLHAKSLAEKQLAYNDKFDSIVMKVSPNGRYCVVDWGCEIAFDDNKMSGSAYCTKYRVNKMEDWMELEELDVNDGMFGEQLEALKLIKNGLKDETPFVETIFNPLMVAGKLTKDKKLVLKTMQEKPEMLKEALKIITKVMTDFAKISIENGAAGIFLATQEASYDMMTEEEFKEFGMIYDHQLLNAIKNKTEFNIVHIHGDNIMFDLIANNYDVEALNWHDQLTKPTIAEGFSKFKGILMGGIEEKEYLLQNSIEDLTTKLDQIISSVEGKRLIISPGCVIPINIPDEKVEAIINHLKNS